MAVTLRPGKTPDGAEVALVLRHVVRAISSHWPAVDILIRGDTHYIRPEAMAWVERNRVGHVLGLAGNRVLLKKVADLAEHAAMARIAGNTDTARRYGEFRYAARTWPTERQVIARVEASAHGSDSRFIVTNLKGAPPRAPSDARRFADGSIACCDRWLYDEIYCARGQAENLIKAHKLHLASDRTSCRQGDGEPVPAADPYCRLLARAHAARPGAQNLVLARRPVRHHPARADQGRRPGH